MPKYITSKEIGSTITTLQRTSEKINNYNNRTISAEQLQKFKEIIVTQLYKMYKYVMDLYIYGDRSVYIKINHENVYGYIKKINDSAEITKELLKEVLSDFLSDYEVFTMRINDIQDHQLNRMFEDRNATGVRDANYLSNDLEDIIKVINSIKTSGRTINYVNPQCYDKRIDDYYKEYIDKINLYSIISNNIYTDSMAEDYEKCICDDDYNMYNPLSSGRNIKISNNVFDIMHIKPKISSIVQKKNNLYSCQSYEQYALTDNFRLLRKHGVLVYTIPYCRLSNEIIMYLAKNLRNISIIKRENDLEKLITIVGYKFQNKSYSEEYNRIKKIAYHEIGTEIEYEYTLPLKLEEVLIFRGGKINEKDVENIILNDDLYNDFYVKRNRRKEKYDDKPLLPFNIGQIGLILTSGKLDGVVNEPDNIKHIIKGRTIKYTENIDSDNANIARSQKVSNKVQINAFDAEGNFIVIS